MLQVICMFLGVLVIMYLQRLSAKTGKKMGGFVAVAIIIMAIVMMMSSYKYLQPPKADTTQSSEDSTQK